MLQHGGVTDKLWPDACPGQNLVFVLSCSVCLGIYQQVVFFIGFRFGGNQHKSAKKTFHDITMILFRVLNKLTTTPLGFEPGPLVTWRASQAYSNKLVQ